MRNITTGALLTNVEQAVLATLSPNSTASHSASIATTNGGSYLIQVTTDSEDAIFEYDGISHASAEANNTASAGFQITTFFNVSAPVLPGGRGDVDRRRASMRQADGFSDRHAGDEHVAVYFC